MLAPPRSPMRVTPKCHRGSTKVTLSECRRGRLIYWLPSVCIPHPTCACCSSVCTPPRPVLQDDGMYSVLRTGDQRLAETSKVGRTGANIVCSYQWLAETQPYFSVFNQRNLSGFPVLGPRLRTHASVQKNLFCHQSST